MSGRSGSSFASGMSGRGAGSGRGGRERQGAAQSQGINDFGLSSGSESSSQDENAEENVPRPSEPRLYRRGTYSLWTEEKITTVLQAVLDTPRRMLQNPPADNGFERVLNKSGGSKVSIDKLECVVLWQRFQFLSDSYGS